MKMISSRIYNDDNDFQIILDLTTQLRPPERLHDYPGKTDIEENLASATVRANTRLWFDEDQPVAWCYVNEFANLIWELDKHYEQTLGTEIVEWGISCIGRELKDKKSSTLDASCRDDFSERISFLKKHGFQQIQDTTVSMRRLLSEPIPVPTLSPGFIIRPIAGKQEAEAVAAMHRAAFGTDYMTAENRLIIMNTSEYDPSLDLVIVAPDGSIAGNCICSVNEQQKRGMTDPVSVHPRFQRMGLARALILTGLRLLRERGMETAHLGTSGDNRAMQKTAGSAGFTIEYKTIWFSKPVDSDDTRK